MSSISSPAPVSEFYRVFYSAMSILMLTIALFTGAILVPIFFLTAAYALSELVIRKRISTAWIKGDHLIPLIFGFWGYALISCFWSLAPMSGALTVWKYITLFLLFYAQMRFTSLFSRAQSEHIMIATFVGMLCAGAVCVNEVLTDARLTKIFRYILFDFKHGYMSTLNKGSVFLGMMVWPMVYWLASKRKYFITVIFWLFIAYTTSILESATATLGLVLATIAFGVSFWVSRKFLVRLISISLIVYSFALPLAFHHLPIYRMAEGIPKMNDSVSARTRLLMLRFNADKAMEKPIFGWGLGSSKDIGLMGATDPYFSKIDGAVALNHPHNGTMQVMLELGFVGLALFVGIYILVLTRIATAIDPLLYACGLGIFINLWGTQQTGFGVWQNWHLCGALIAAAWLIIARNTAPERQIPKALV